MSRREEREHLLDIYGVRLHLATTPRQLAAIADRFGGLETDPGNVGATELALDTSSPTNDAHVVVYVNAAAHDGDSSGALLAGTVAHEASHAAGMILDHVGASSGANEEHVAYLVGWVAAWVWGRL